MAFTYKSTQFYDQVFCYHSAGFSKLLGVYLLHFNNEKNLKKISLSRATVNPAIDENAFKNGFNTLQFVINFINLEF